MFRNYFKTAFRNLFRNKIYSFINITGLSIGLACVMLIILYVKDELSYDRFQEQRDHIYRVVNKWIKPDGSIESMNSNSGFLQGPRFKAGVPEIGAFVRLQSDQRDIKIKNDIRSEQVFSTDSNFFSVFSFPLLSGNPKTALLQPNSIVISEDMAEKQFGAKNALGKTIQMRKDDKFETYIVTGVAKKCPQNSSIKFQALVPIRVSEKDEQVGENWFSFFLNTFVVLRAGADTLAVNKKIQMAYETDAREAIRMAAEKYDAKNRAVYFLQPFTQIHLSKDLRAINGLSDSSNPMFSYILTGIALFILLIACINFVNLTVARSVKRAKEIGIRKVVGGNRKQLMLQFLGESFILCAIAFILAILLVQAVLPLFNDLSNKALALSYLFDTKLIAGYIVLFIATGLLAGFYPAIVLSSYNPVQTLYNRFNLAGKNYLQKGLVVIQFALASFLIIATVTIFSQFNYLTTEKLGYDDSNLVTVNIWPLSRDKAKLFREELIKNVNILDAAPKNGGYWGTIAKINGDSTLQFAYETVDESYLPLLKIPIVAGRNFSSYFPSDSSHSVLVNETFVKKAGWKHPIGQVLDFFFDNHKKYQVIGVVKDHHYESLSREIGPQVFTMKPSNDYGMVYIKIRPNSATAALRHIEKTFKKIFPINPYSYEFKDLQNLKSYESEAKWKQIMLFGAILTILISSIGLFGLSVLSVEKRTKEIGIRKVLGASVVSVVNVLSRDFLKLVIIAILISMPIAWISANKWLQNYPYRITLSWWLFAAAGLLVVLIAMATVSYQSIKTALMNPVRSLRTE